MVEHTPGPWRAFKTAASERWCIDAQDEPIADAYRGRAEANARLIAAAPDLSEALQALAGDCGDDSDDEDAMPWPNLARARAAIAKAIGFDNSDRLNGRYKENSSYRG